MNCERFREAHPEAGPEALAHRASCESCRAYAAAWEALGAYPALEPGPGFLGGVYRKLTPAVLRFAAPVAALAAALLVALLLWTSPSAGDGVTPEERELVENLELLENFELLKTLELVRDASSPLLEEKK